MVDFICNGADFENLRTVLITEGLDDATFLNEVLTKMHADPKSIGIYYAKSKVGVFSFIPVFVKVPQFTSGTIRSFGIIIDADTNHAQTLSDAHRALSKAQQACPASGEVMVTPNSSVAVGVYLFPEPGKNGILEDACLLQLPETDASREAMRFVQSHMPDGENHRFGKRAVQAYLSVSKPDLCAGVGRAIRNGSFPLDLTKFSRLTSFVESLL